MNILFIVCSFWAMGEYTIAKEFALDLKEKGHNVAFCLSPSHYKKAKKHFMAYSLIPHSRKLNQILFHEINHYFKPQLVILSDFLNYHFAHTHYGILDQDLDIFTAYRASFDIYNWKRKRERMDTYGFESTIYPNLNMANYGERIIPCPLENPDKVDSEAFAYCLTTRRVERMQKANAWIYEKFGLSPNKKVLFITNATWQSQAVEEKMVKDFLAKVQKSFETIVSYLQERHQIVFVGQKEELPLPGNNLFYYDHLEAKDFDHLISITDLYISRNSISTSMARMVLSGVSCVNFIHSGFNSSREQLFSYKFRMYPVGWYDFLAPIVADNPYFNLVESLEIFDLTSSIKRIEQILSRDENVYRKKWQSYRELLNRLDSPCQIVTKIIER